MSLKAGIVGLPNVGKSTIFNAITKKNILAANYPFATIDPNKGVVTVPDSRLEYLENLYIPERVIPTTYEFTDIAGLVKGAATGEGLGNKFLSHIREVDAIAHVVRCFDNPDIIHVANKVDPVQDIEVVNLELALSDLELVQNRLGKIAKKVQMTKDKNEQAEYQVLLKCEKSLQNNIALREVEFSNEELLLIKNFNLITLKPIIYLANVDEETAVIGDNEYTLKVKEYAHNSESGVVVMSAKIESELAELNEIDRQDFLVGLGITNSGLDKLIFATYNLLGLATFFTVGKDEVRAWTFKMGSRAPECAGIIHSDFEKGFIKAEVMRFDDLEKYGSEIKIKEAGRLRLEGKEYLMQDGDICLFRFNV